jgi:hypothetical protein
MTTPSRGVAEAGATLSRIREFGQRDEWKGCSLTAVKMAENRSNDVTTPMSSITNYFENLMRAAKLVKNTALVIAIFLESAAFIILIAHRVE